MLENILENVDRSRTVLFKPLSAENVEKRSDSIIKNEKEAISLKARIRKRLEETCEENPKMEKYGIGGGVMVSETNFESKTVKTHEGGGSGNLRYLMQKFGRMANGTYDETFGAKKTIPIFERAMAVPGCDVMMGRFCSKPMAESLQRKSCHGLNMNIFRSDPHKL